MRRNGIKLRGTLLCGLAAAVWSGAAGAQTPRRFDVRLVPAGAVLAATAAVAVTPVVFAAHLPHATCAPCDPSGLSALDRGAVGRVRAGPALASDLGLAATGGAAGMFLLLDAAGDGARAREDLAVLAQAVVTATALTNWTKVLVHRPRPERYLLDAAASARDAESGLSFPSGHTSAAFAAAAAVGALQARRGRAGPHRARIAALAVAAAATGALRVAAHKHFPTDVLAGAALGGAVGFAVPRLYALRP